MQPAPLNLSVVPGSPFVKPLLLMQPVFAYRAISAVQKTAPLLVSVPNHGMPTEWPCWIEGSDGWPVLNRDKLKERFRVAAAIDADTLEFNDLNGTQHSASGGHLVYRLPVVLVGASASLTISDHSGLLVSLSTGGGGLAIADAGVLTLSLTGEQTAVLSGKRASYSLSVTMADGSVNHWLKGDVNAVS